MSELYWGIIAMLVVLVLLMYGSHLYRQYRLRHYEVPAQDMRKGHRWFMVDVFPDPTYCNVGKYHIIHGARCDSCGACVDDCNMRKANAEINCKQVCTRGDTMEHHWIKGNLPLCSTCAACGGECECVELCHRRCCWCQRTMHDDCTLDTNICDMGKYRTEIIPPNCIDLKWVGIKGRKHLIVKSVRKPSITGWSPLIVIANRKSGSNDGEQLLRAFRFILNPTQVIDLHDIPLQVGLEWCHLLPVDTDIRILVCGGDGTISWVLKSIEKHQFMKPPRVCILPLGTGNDLSQVLGWGEGYTGDVEVSEVLDSLKKAYPVKLDRWKVEISHEKHFGIAVPKLTRVRMMNNYLSVGVDALVTLNFHKQRESWPGIFANRLINKFAYFTYGTKDVLERECKHLQKKMKVELDGRVIDLPDIEGIVVLNISSWGGGCRPWSLAADDLEFQPSRYDDGLLEVMALYSSFHIAQLQVGVASPCRLGQARKVKITLFSGKAPIQVDGEPWEQLPAQIVITHRGQAAMLELPT